MLAEHHDRFPLAGRAALCLAASFAMLALSTAPATAADAKVIHQLGIGEGINTVGIMPGGKDVEATGPQAMYMGEDGKLYVLDQINGRILSMDADNPQAPPKELKLPDNLSPNDLVTVNNQLYVWDGQVHALSADPGKEGSPLEARAVGDVDDVTRSAFAQMGSQTPSSDEDVLNTAGRSLNTSTFDTPIKSTLQSRALGAINVDVLPRKDGKSAVIELRPDSDPLQVNHADVKVKDKLGVLEVLDVTAKGDVFVFTEDVPLAGKGSSTYVARYNAKGKLVSIFDMPISPDQLASKRFVTISPGGSVLFLKSDATGVAIVELKGRTPASQTLEPPKVKVAAAEPTDLGPGIDADIVTAVRPNSRLGAIRMGLAFEGLKWTVTQQNYGPDPDPTCTGFADRTRRPWYLSGKVGQEVRGVPYCWGCFGTILQFKRNVERGVLAGNICTKNDPRRDVAGVDCSAFVSACWGLSHQYTTQDIPSITEPVQNPWDMKPGDAFNKAGSHVMLFVKFTPDRKAEVLESSTGGCNGRVCRNVYPLSVLLARGYKPVRYKALTD